MDLLKDFYSTSKYFPIALDNLGKNSLFSFHLFLYDPVKDEYKLVLKANEPLTLEKVEFIKALESKGAELTILYSQKQTFLTTMNLKEADVPGLLSPILHPLRIKQQNHLLQLQKEDREKGPFNISSELERAISKHYFTRLLERARKEIMAFPVDESPTVSLAVYLTECLLIENNPINQLVALTYFLAKQAGHDSAIELGDLVCAAYLCHLGRLEYNISITRKNKSELKTWEAQLEQRHPEYALRFLKRSEIHLSEQCQRLILNHHHPTTALESFISNAEEKLTHHFSWNQIPTKRVA